MEGVCARNLVIGPELSSLTNDGFDQCSMQKSLGEKQSHGLHSRMYPM